MKIAQEFIIGNDYYLVIEDESNNELDDLYFLYINNNYEGSYYNLYFESDANFKIGSGIKDNKFIIFLNGKEYFSIDTKKDKLGRFDGTLTSYGFSKNEDIYFVINHNCYFKLFRNKTQIGTYSEDSGLNVFDNGKYIFCTENSSQDNPRDLVYEIDGKYTIISPDCDIITYDNPGKVLFYIIKKDGINIIFKNHKEIYTTCNELSDLFLNNKEVFVYEKESENKLIKIHL